MHPFCERLAGKCRWSTLLIVHCASQKQAKFIMDLIRKRLKGYNLELNLEKTRVVYAGKYNDYDHEGHTIPRKFTFLGYDFKPRSYKGRTVFTPAIGQGAMKMIRQKLQALGIMSMTHRPLEEVAEKLNPLCRGWINYYGPIAKGQGKSIRKKEKGKSKDKLLKTSF